MLWLQNDTWDVEMLSILQRFVDPSLEHLRAHLDLTILRLEASALRLYLGHILRVSTGSDSFITLPAAYFTSEFKVRTLASTILTVHILS